MEKRRTVRVVGGGPAGASAALAALRAGAGVEIFEKSAFPRHKVCGEFLSPGLLPLLDELGLTREFFDRRPAEIRRMSLHLGRTRKVSPLPEPAWGLSRRAFDAMLLTHAVASGASLKRAAVSRPEPGQVWAAGRNAQARRGGRLFGFKAHFAGPAEDAVELFFFGGCYIGVNAIEEGLTNVCGLAPEETLRAHGFEPDALLAAYTPLRERLNPMRREMPWLTTGPLVFANHFATGSDVYLAGDAMSFIDPFTGSGLLSAVLTGTAAGTFAAQGLPIDEYVRFCRTSFTRPFRCASWLRERATERWAESLLPLVPGRLLFALTRPKKVA